MFKEQVAHDKTQEQNAEPGKPRIRKWGALRWQGCWCPGFSLTGATLGFTGLRVWLCRLPSSDFLHTEYPYSSWENVLGSMSSWPARKKGKLPSLHEESTPNPFSYDMDFKHFRPTLVDTEVLRARETMRAGQTAQKILKIVHRIIITIC